jgi:hypothetical protein
MLGTKEYQELLELLEKLKAEGWTIVPVVNAINDYVNYEWKEITIRLHTSEDTLLSLCRQVYNPIQDPVLNLLKTKDILGETRK